VALWDAACGEAVRGDGVRHDVADAGFVWSNLTQVVELTVFTVDWALAPCMSRVGAPLQVL
jgi:hypothetical protein